MLTFLKCWHFFSNNLFIFCKYISMIKINNLEKAYKNKTVLRIDELSFESGCLYLLCGANGAGKSTLVKSILKIIDYYGDIKIDSKIIGYLPERFPEISYISTFTFLKCLKIDGNYQRIEELAAYFDLDLKKSISSLSKGNLQKVMIIQAIMNNANIMIFDEPLNGLDLANQKKFIDLLKSLKDENRCIIITTHYPSYYSSIGDKTIYLEQGNIYESN